MGLSIGAMAFAVDQALEFMTRSAQDAGWQGEVAAVYLAVGVLSAVGVTLFATLLARGLPRRLRHSGRYVDVAAWALLLPYLIPTWERLDSLTPTGGAWTLLAMVSVLAAVGCWVGALRRLSGAPGWAAPVVLSALTLSLLLTVNRNLLSDPLRARALGADAAILLVVAGLSLSLRRWTPRLVFPAVVALLAVSAGVGWIVRGGEPRRASTVDFGADRPPHLILLTIDTLRQDIFESVANTPESRDFLAALSGATFFHQARAAAPWTAPSVATLMTGLLPKEHGYGARTGSVDRPLAGLPDRVPTLAEGLRDAGYRTEAFVANPLLFPGSGIDRGFQSYRALEDFGKKLPWMRLLDIDPQVRQAARWASLGRIRHLPYLQAEEVAARVERRIRRIDDAESTPYFLWVHLMDPHAPYVGHPELSPLPTERPDWRPNSKRARYVDEVRYALRHATRVLEALRDQGLLDDAVTVFTSDHGEMFPPDKHREYRRGEEGATRISGHGHSLHAEVVRVPLAVRGPDATGIALDPRTPVGLVDLPPTLQDLLGLPLGLHQTPSAQSLVESPFPYDRALILAGTEWGPAQRGMVQAGWKLIHFPGGEAADRIFDLRRDPRERWNQAKWRPDQVEFLRRRLEEAWAQTEATHSSAEAQQIDEETRRRLQELGYLE